MKISFDMKIIKNLHMMLSSENYFSWKKSNVDLYEPMIERSAGKVPVDFEELTIEMLICMRPIIERDADGTSVWSDAIWSDQRRGQLLKRLACTEPMIERSADGSSVWSRKNQLLKFGLYGAGDRKECWRRASCWNWW